MSYMEIVRTSFFEVIVTFDNTLQYEDDVLLFEVIDASVAIQQYLWENKSVIMVFNLPGRILLIQTKWNRTRKYLMFKI